LLGVNFLLLAQIRPAHCGCRTVAAGFGMLTTYSQGIFSALAGFVNVSGGCATVQSEQQKNSTA
jgi:hypothetical protein